MSTNDNPNLAISVNNKLKTPLKASVVILTSVILAACGTSGSKSYNLQDVLGSGPILESKDKELEEQKAEAEAAKKEAEAAKKEAEAAKKEAEAAKKEAEAAEKAKEEAEKALEDALAGGGNKAELEKIAEEKAKEAEAAQKAAEEKAKQAQEALQAADDAAEAAKIKNAPESTKSGAQSINVGASVAGLGDFVVTTRDFKAGDNTITARADTASGGLLPAVDIQTSGENDTDVGNGFKSHENSTSIPTALGELPLEYTSVYKDYGDDMRIGHIDGAADLKGTLIPVDGVAVVGHATKAENVPTEGKVRYTGDATHRKLGIGNDIEFGSSVFTADFVAKKVKGDLEFAKAGKIGLTADIDGNKFSGAADANGGYATEGGFYGGDAQYLGGVYEGNGAQGTYGAKTDKLKAADDAKAAADAAKAEAEAAKAAAEKAAAEAEKAKKRAENAGSGDGEALADAEARAEAAEKAQAAAEDAAKAAEDAAKAAEEARKTALAEKEAAEKAAEKAVGDAKKAADAAVEEANKKLEEAEEAAKKAEEAKADAEAAKAAADQRIKELEAKLYAAEPDKSGVQHLSITLGEDAYTTTTRDFTIGDSSVDAQANEALKDNETLKDMVDGPVAIKVSGDSDVDTVNGFKAYEGTGTVLSEGDLGYTSIYKDFGDNGELRIAHIDGAAVGGTVPVNGVVALGNKTATLPTEGTAQYAGDATNRKAGVDGQVEYGSSEFTADFVAKSIDGTLKFKQAGEIALSADIDGNEFSGSAANNKGYNTEGAFYGTGAKYVGGIYEGNGSQGTYGATKDGTPADLVEPEPELPEPPVNEKHDPETDLTGFQSNTLSSKKSSFTDDAIGYAEIRDDKSDYTETKDVDGSKVPIDNGKGNNFTSYDKFTARADMTKPDSVKEKVEVNISGASDTDYGNGFKLHTESTKVQGPIALDLNYSSVYRNFDNQMQIGHIYGDPRTDFFGLGDLARVSTVFVQGNATNLEDMKYMRDLAQYNLDNDISDGMVSYTGVATYMENLHLKDGTRGGPVVDGTSSFNVDFINNSVKGELTFGEGDYKHMPQGNKIGIEATIDGNTFKGNANNIDTAGGFYGEDAKFLGGIYQQALEVGGKGGQPGEGTTFQGTFGAEKQPAK